MSVEVSSTSDLSARIPVQERPDLFEIVGLSWRNRQLISNSSLIETDRAHKDDETREGRIINS